MILGSFKEFMTFLEQLEMTKGRNLSIMSDIVNNK